MTSSTTAETAASAVPSIEVSATETGLSIVGRTVALAGGDYEGRMKVEKSGPSGRTSTTQGSSFSLASGEAATVATIGLSMAAGDTLDVELVVSADGRELARSTIELGR